MKAMVIRERRNQVDHSTGQGPPRCRRRPTGPAESFRRAALDRLHGEQIAE